MSLKQLLPSVIVLFSMSVSGLAEARVFDLGHERLATYFGFTGGPSAVGKSAFENEAGTAISISNEVKYNYSGEFGLVYSHPVASVRFGLEILKPQSLDNLVGNNGSADLYSESSEIIGYAPKFSLDFNIYKSNVSRSFVSATIGYATIMVKNLYTLTAAGQTAYPNMDGKMEAKGTGPLYSASVGHEIFLSDTTTALLEVGYRRLNVTSLKYSRAGNYFGTAHNDGEVVLNNGSPRNIDLSGMYLGLSFRFYM